ncbi:MAG TPA: MarR family transcriptional regulator, partial [Clostridiales bacterium]|nr:MarR family transcriptional regulator [Clostridiales bacterium]
MTYDPAEALKLDNQLCFPLYAAARKVTGLYAPYLKELGLTYTQYIVLLVLWERDGLSLGEIGERLSLDSGTLTPLCKKLETAGLITRRRSEQDERSVRITLT